MTTDYNENEVSTWKLVKVTIKPTANSKFASPGDITIGLSGGENLGLVQSLELKAEVGTFPTLKLTSLVNESELEVLQKNTELNVVIQDWEAYSLGIKSVNELLNKDSWGKEKIFNNYQENSYGSFLFEKGRKDALANRFPDNKSIQKILK